MFSRDPSSEFGRAARLVSRRASRVTGPAASQALSPPGSAPRRPQALRSLSIRVTQIAAKGTIRPSAMEIMNNAPNWL